MKKNGTEKTKERIIQFDSCSALINALALYLHRKDFPGAGIAPDAPAWLGKGINLLPLSIRQTLFSWSGWLEALPAASLKDIQEEDISRWVISLYPERKYSGIMFGSANGGAIHIAAALGIPWLPQTYLTAVRRFLPPDEIKKDIEWGKKQ